MEAGAHQCPVNEKDDENSKNSNNYVEMTYDKATPTSAICFMIPDT